MELFLYVAHHHDGPPTAVCHLTAEIINNYFTESVESVRCQMFPAHGAVISNPGGNKSAN